MVSSKYHIFLPLESSAYFSIMDREFWLWDIIASKKYLQVSETYKNVKYQKL